MHIGYFHHTWELCLKKSRYVPSHCGWSGPVAQVIESGTKWLTAGPFLSTIRAAFISYSIFQIYNFLNSFIPYKQYNSLGYLSYFYFLHCMKKIIFGIVHSLNYSNTCNFPLLVSWSHRTSITIVSDVYEGFTIVSDASNLF